MMLATLCEISHSILLPDERARCWCEDAHCSVDNSVSLMMWKLRRDYVESLNAKLKQGVAGISQATTEAESDVQGDECISLAAEIGVGTINNGDSSHSTLTVDTTFPVDDSSIGDSNNTTSPTPNGTSVRAAGRPAGSTTSNKRDLNTLLRLATAEAATVYKNTMDEVWCNKDNNSGMCRLAKGALTRIIDNAKTKYNVSSCTTICSSTIRSRYKRNNENPATAQGTQSPMAAVEPYLASVIL